MGTAAPHFTQTTEFAEMKSRPDASGEQLRRLNGTHREIIRYLVAGHTNAEVANLLGVGAGMVSNLVNNELGAAAIERGHAARDSVSAEAAIRIQEASLAAIETLEDVMEDGTNSAVARVSAANSVLDRAGHGAVKKVEIHTRTSVYSRDDVSNIREQAALAQTAKPLDVTKPAEIEDGTSNS